MFEFDDSTEWTSEYPYLQELDELLRCPVCHEFIDGALMSEDCGHLFCSLCIRRVLAVKKQCPSCFFSLNESQLIQVKHLDKVAHSFRKSRKSILKILRTKNTPNQNITLSDAENRNEEQDEYQATNPLDKTTPKRKNGHFDTPYEFEKPDSVIFHIEDSKKIKQDRESIKLVECPSCKDMILESNMNLHLDRCLEIDPKVSEEKPKAQISLLSLMNRKKSEKKMPRPIKIVYSVLSDSKLRKTLKDLELPTHGTRSQLEARHSEWVNRYWANEDSLDAKPHSKLLEELISWETSLQSSLQAKSTVANIDISEYLAKNADVFEELKRKAKETLSQAKT